MMGNIRAKEQLKVARRHLERVQGAWDAPTDWSDLSLYGFYCLEAAVMAAAKYFGIDVKRTHPCDILTGSIDPVRMSRF